MLQESYEPSREPDDKRHRHKIGGASTVTKEERSRKSADNKKETKCSTKQDPQPAEDRGKRFGGECQGHRKTVRREKCLQVECKLARRATDSAARGAICIRAETGGRGLRAQHAHRSQSSRAAGRSTRQETRRSSQSKLGRWDAANVGCACTKWPMHGVEGARVVAGVGERTREVSGDKWVEFTASPHGMLINIVSLCAQ